MRQHFLLTVSFFLICPFLVNAQRLKYKDVFPVIQAGKWEEAEQLLKTYLSDPKNKGEANAHYNLGKAYERKALAASIVSDTTVLFSNIDSANFHFEASLQLIDEKELKKNDEFYQEFNRRDLRTGEFGIKVSDVHLDIENKIKALNDRKKNVGTFLRESANVKRFYNEVSDQLLDFKTRFGKQASFLLAIGKDEEQQLSLLGEKAKSLETSLATAEAALAAIPAPGLSHVIQKNELADLAQFTKSTPDITGTGTINLWDFAGWLEAVRSSLKADVEPFRQKLVAYDRELVAKRQKLVQSGQVDEVPGQVDPSLLSALREYGNNSMAERVIDYKVQELNYLSGKRPEALPDSTKVDDMYAAHEALLGRLDKMKSLIDMSGNDISEAFKRNPVFFQSRYVSEAQLSDYVTERKSFVDLEWQQWDQKTEYWKKRRNWLITAANDSISLTVLDSVLTPVKFSTLHVTDSAGLYATGLRNKGKDLIFFIAKAAPSYRSEWLQEEPLPLPDKGFVFRRKNVDHAPTAEGYHSFYIYYPLKGKTHLFISTIDDTGKLLWKASMDIDRPPVNISFNKMVMETVIYLEKPEGDPTNDLAYIVVDRNGKVRK